MNKHHVQLRKVILAIALGFVYLNTNNKLA